MLEVLAVIAIVAYVIGRQMLGEALRGKRVILLPVVLTVIGLTRLGGGGHHVRPVDVAFLAASGLIALGIGLGQGAVMHLEERDGGLWGRMPARGLLLWVALVGSRVVAMMLAGAAGAHVAASSAPILLMLGVNRLGQAAMITRRALSAGIPFAGERDGSVFLGDRLSGPGPGDGPGDGRTARGGPYGAVPEGARHEPYEDRYEPRYEDPFDARREARYEDPFDAPRGYEYGPDPDTRQTPDARQDAYDDRGGRGRDERGGHGRDPYGRRGPYDGQDPSFGDDGRHTSRGGRRDHAGYDARGGLVGGRPGALDGLGASLRDLRDLRAARGNRGGRGSSRRYR